MKLKDKLGLGIATIGLATAMYMTKPQTELPESHRVTISDHGSVTLQIHDISSIDIDGRHYYGLIPSKSYYDREGDGIVDTIVINEPKKMVIPLPKILTLDPKNSYVYFESDLNLVYFNDRINNPDLFKKADEEIKDSLNIINKSNPDYIETNGFKAWNYRHHGY